MPIDHSLVEYLIDNRHITDLLEKAKQIKSFEIRKIIYDILIYLIDRCYNYTWVKIGNNSIDMVEKEKLQTIIEKKTFLKKLFEEKYDLLVKLIKIALYNEKDFSIDYVKITIQYFI